MERSIVHLKRVSVPKTKPRRLQCLRGKIFKRKVFTTEAQSHGEELLVFPCSSIHLRLWTRSDLPSRPMLRPAPPFVSIDRRAGWVSAHLDWKDRWFHFGGEFPSQKRSPQRTLGPWRLATLVANLRSQKSVRMSVRAVTGERDEKHGSNSAGRGSEIPQSSQKQASIGDPTDSRGLSEIEMLRQLGLLALSGFRSPVRYGRS